MKFIRDAIFGNWRNKGVALFFAVIIWVVAFEAQFSEEPVPVKVQLLPRQTNQVVLKQYYRLPDNSLQPFNGRIEVTVNGTRKQVVELKKNVRDVFEIRVDGPSGPDAEPTNYVFTREDFQFKSFSLIEMVKFNPPFVRVWFDTQETREFSVQSSFKLPAPGLEIERESLDPSEVTVSGPSSLLDKIQVIAEPEFGVSEDAWVFNGTVPLKIVPSEIDGIAVGELVTIGPRRTVDLYVRLDAKVEEFEEEQVPIRFSTPPSFPYTVSFEGDEIPIMFSGPEQEIKNLKAEIERADFFLSVKIDVAGLDGSKADERTFTEGDLLLHGGYSRDVQILKHSKREREGLWSYSLLPTQSSNENEE